MKKVMVIGAGRGQIPVMELCRSYGWKVVVVSPKGDYPGFQYADEVVYEDVRNKEAVLEYARNNQISAIVTDQLDAGVQTVAYVAENLNLPGIGLNVAKKFTNKFVMRQEAEKAGIHVPKNCLVDEMDEIPQKIKEMKFPLIMKPVDSAASCGVFKVESVEDIQKHFGYTKSFSSDGRVIIEEFIVGREFVVESFVNDGKVTNLIVGHRDYFDIEGTLIPNATVFCDAESCETLVEKKVLEENTKLIEAYGMSFGITHGEYLYDERDGKVYLVEIAARGGGVFISSDIIPLACGVNANDLLVKKALGLAVEENIRLKKGAAAYFCYLTPEGKVIKIEGTEKVEQSRGVYKAYFDNVELGMTTASIRDKTSRKGPIIVYATDKKGCYEVIDKVKAQLEIIIQTSKGNENIIWN